jgi:hypothetical protein
VANKSENIGQNDAIFGKVGSKCKRNVVELSVRAQVEMSQECRASYALEIYRAKLPEYVSTDEICARNVEISLAT